MLSCIGLWNQYISRFLEKLYYHKKYFRYLQLQKTAAACSVLKQVTSVRLWNQFWDVKWVSLIDYLEGRTINFEYFSLVYFIDWTKNSKKETCFNEKKIFFIKILDDNTISLNIHCTQQIRTKAFSIKRKRYISRWTMFRRAWRKSLEKCYKVIAGSLE